MQYFLCNASIYAFIFEHMLQFSSNTKKTVVNFGLSESSHVPSFAEVVKLIFSTVNKLQNFSRKLNRKSDHDLRGSFYPQIGVIDKVSSFNGPSHLRVRVTC